MLTAWHNARLAAATVPTARAQPLLEPRGEDEIDDRDRVLIVRVDRQLEALIVDHHVRMVIELVGERARVRRDLARLGHRALEHELEVAALDRPPRSERLDLLRQLRRRERATADRV